MILPILLVTSSAVQRVAIAALTRCRINDLTLLNAMTFMSMFASAAVLKYMIPWPGPMVFSWWYIALFFGEAIGTALMTLTLIMIPVSKQVIYARGCELMATMLFDMIFPRRMESSFERYQIQTIFSLAFLGAVAFPIANNIWDAESAAGFASHVGSLFLVSVRSGLYALISVGEDTLLRNYATPPSTILLVEILGASVTTVLVVLPFSSVQSVQDSLSLSTTMESLNLLGNSTANFLLFLCFLVACAVQNASRVLVVRKHTAVFYAFFGVLVAPVTMSLSFLAYQLSDTKFGEQFSVGLLWWDLVSFSLVTAASVLLVHWNKRPRALYKLGIEAQKAASYRCGKSSTESVTNGLLNTGVVLSAYPASAIERVTKSGVACPASSIGCYAGFASDYKLCAAFFREIACLYHQVEVDLGSGLLLRSGVELNAKTAEEELHSIPPMLTSCMKVHHWSGEDSVRWRTCRNFAAYPLPSEANSEHRRDIQQLVREALARFAAEALAKEEVDFVGDWVETELKDLPTIWPIHEYEAMQTGGLLKDWPNSRSEFVWKRQLRAKECAGENKTLPRSRLMAACQGVAIRRPKIEVSVLVNEEDHLRFIAKVEEPTLEAVCIAWEQWRRIVDFIGSAVKLGAQEVDEEANTHGVECSYAFLPEFGYLASCPSNIGTGFKIGFRGSSGFTRTSERRLGARIEQLCADALAVSDAGNLMALQRNNVGPEEYMLLEN